MPARPQDTCYPSQALTTSDSRYPGVCTKCNWTNPETVSNCKSLSAQTPKTKCATCNTVCQAQKQNYCTIGHENINTHATVGKYTEICHVKDEFIFRNWTAAWWNDYQDDLLTADKMGRHTPHNNGVSYSERAVADPCNNNHPANSLVTAKKYNEQKAALAKFGVTIPGVKGAAEVGCEAADVIRAAHALALKTGFNNAKFDSDVCDTCNTATQFTNKCTCNCSCSCSCVCPCSSVGSSSGCTGCGCSCGCYCPCFCPCPTAKIETAYEGVNNPGQHP